MEENLCTEPVINYDTGIEPTRVRFERKSKPMLNPLDALGKPKRAGSEVNDSEHVEDI